MVAVFFKMLFYLAMIYTSSKKCNKNIMFIYCSIGFKKPIRVVAPKKKHGVSCQMRPNSGERWARSAVSSRSRRCSKKNWSYLPQTISDHSDPEHAKMAIVPKYSSSRRASDPQTGHLFVK